MKLAQIPNCHLTYCTNIHPGESWQDVWSQFRRYLPAVKHSVSPNRHFGIGARLSRRAVSELLQGSNLPLLKAWLTTSGLYIFTINGFPYGQFHQQQIKEKVYFPDWSEDERLEYTKELALALAELLPVNCTGTISTVPIGLKTYFHNNEKLITARNNILAMVAFLIQIKSDSGKLIQLALEPEPGCYLEMSSDIVSFFYNYVLTDSAMSQLKAVSTTSFQPSPDLVLQHLGICLDTCHTSVMYETPRNMAITLMKNGISIYKVQLTAALSTTDIDHEGLSVLQQLSDPVYLHQTSISNSNGQIQYFMDLPDALEQLPLGQNLRVHYHVPVFTDKINSLETTQEDLIDFLEYFLKNPLCEHLEVETYTFDVLPREFRHSSVVDNISKELQWVMDTLDK